MKYAQKSIQKEIPLNQPHTGHWWGVEGSREVARPLFFLSEPEAPPPARFVEVLPWARDMPSRHLYWALKSVRAASKGKGVESGLRVARDGRFEQPSMVLAELLRYLEPVGAVFERDGLIWLRVNDRFESIAAKLAETWLQNRLQADTE